MKTVICDICKSPCFDGYIKIKKMTWGIYDGTERAHVRDICTPCWELIVTQIKDRKEKFTRKE